MRKKFYYILSLPPPPPLPLSLSLSLSLSLYFFCFILNLNHVCEMYDDRKKKRNIFSFLYIYASIHCTLEGMNINKA